MEALVTTPLPTEHGSFDISAYPSGVEEQPHLVLKSPVKAGAIPLVRVHSECWTGDVVGSLKCDCGPQLNHALEKVAQEGGAVIYLRQEGRGIGLVEKLKAYNLQEQGLDTFEANQKLGHQRDARSFSIAGEICKSLGWDQIRLMTNNPEKVSDLREAGVKVVEVLPLVIAPNPYNERYLQSKAMEVKAEGKGA